MERDLEREQQESERNTSKLVLKWDTDLTANLRDMIASLTPQKSKPKARKSLHVGGAKGLLGKRPLELDQSEDEDGTPKRLKGRESPVKSIKLPAPPSKIQTTGLKSIPKLGGDENGQTDIPSNRSPARQSSSGPHTEDASPMKPDAASVLAPSEQSNGNPSGSIEAYENEQIHLQDFLNMTSIRFMELTTTKRRHTTIPKPDAASKVANNYGNAEGHELESCVIAGTCTVPMLELYQHVRFTSRARGC